MTKYDTSVGDTVWPRTFDKLPTTTAYQERSDTDSVNRARITASGLGW